MSPDRAIATITDALKADDRIRGLFLSGSHATGLDDAWSDIDFLIVSPEATEVAAGLFIDAAGRTGEIVLCRDRIVRPALVNIVTAEGLRLDAIILKPDQMGGHSQATLKPLFDRDGLYDALPERPASSATPPARLRYQFEEFIRILGLLPVAAGREEYLNGVTGVFHLRNLLVDLLVEETAAPYRGGALHLNRLITDEQKELLASLPVPAPTRRAMIDAHLAYARAYLPRARRLAQARGIDWPERFESATWDLLHTTLCIVPE